MYMSVWCSLSETKIILWEFMFTFIYMNNFSERKKIRLYQPLWNYAQLTGGYGAGNKKKEVFISFFSFLLDFEL